MGRIRHSDEILEKAINLRLLGNSVPEIAELTGISTSSLKSLFHIRNIKLNSEQKQKALSRRWLGHSPVVNGLKKCSVCNENKPIEKFHKNSRSASGLNYSCKSCYSNNYRENAKIIKDRVNKYRKINIDKIKLSQKDHYDKNSSIYSQKALVWATENKEKRKLIEKKWRSNNKEHRNFKCSEYRAKKRQAMPAWLTKYDRDEIKRIYSVVPSGYHVDHIVPIQGENVCGLHVPWNLQYLPKYQNESKGNKFLDIIVNSSICHQFQRKLDTAEEDIANGMPLNAELKDFTLLKEEMTLEHSEFIKRYEWLATVGYAPKWVFAARFKGFLGGVIIISEPNGYTKDKILEALISRGATASWTPKNLGSKLLMFSCNWMVANTSKRVFFGYSDHEAGEIGTIYQACNFQYLGRYFGSKAVWILKNGKKVTSRYFSKTSTYKRYALELGILWQKDWNKENGYMNLKNIPPSILTKFKEKGIHEKSGLICEVILPKSKYVFILGKDRRDYKQVKSIYTQIFGIGLPYPKRTILK